MLFFFVFAVCPAGWKPGSDTVSIHEANTCKVLIILYIDEILNQSNEEMWAFNMSMSKTYLKTCIKDKFSLRL